MILMIIVGASINHLLEREHQRPIHHPMEVVDNAVKQLETQPIEQFGVWSQSNFPRSKIRFYLADMNNTYLTAQAQPLAKKEMKVVKKQMAQLHSAAPMHFKKRRTLTIGRIVETKEGAVKLLIKITSPRQMFRDHFIHNIWLRLLTGLLVSAIVCFLLARYITLPIRRLRHATAKLAKGDYSARTGIKARTGKDEITRLAKDFDHMAENLQNAAITQQQLIKDISHELRSPIARLDVALELARRRLHLENTPELDRIQKESEMLNQLIAQILSLPQLESTTAEFDDVIDLVALLKLIQEDANFEAQQNDKKVVFETQLSEALLATKADLLHSAIENVLRNAVRYTATNSEVEITIEELDENYLISIRDHGPGLEKSELTRIFDAFYRVSQARDRDSGGFGLGLSIAKRAIELHGGSISAGNWQEGLEVLIVLPVRDIHE